MSNSDPMTTPSVEQPQAPVPGGDDEEAIELEPPIPNPNEIKEQ